MDERKEGREGGRDRRIGNLPTKFKIHTLLLRSTCVAQSYLPPLFGWLGTEHSPGLEHLSKCLPHERLPCNLHRNHVTCPLEHSPH